MLLTLLLACVGPGTEAPSDADGDGYSITDCNDESAAAYPGAEEVCDGIDNNCDGRVDEEGGMTLHADVDGDGYGDPAWAETFCEPDVGWVGNFDDCDDSSAANNPDATEVCDGVDNNCDGKIDDDDENLEGGDWSFDNDGDGYGGDLQPLRCSYEEGYVLDGGDCDDKDDTLSPGVDELCDGIDNDCDGLVDADDDSAVDAVWWFIDGDGDGYGDEESGIFSCEDIAGRIDVGGDCDDADVTINPGVAEIEGNGIDDNCNDVENEQLIADAVVSWSATYDTDAAGTSVAGAGDVNGDGYDDLIIGAPGQDEEGEDAGSAFVFFGGPGQPTTWTLDDAGAALYGEQYADMAGAAVAGAGDVNGDGYDDLLVGAPGRNSATGAVYLLLGPITGRLELDDADSRLGGEDTDYHAGAALSTAGDVDGDGLDDVIVGAPGDTKKQVGRAYLLAGSEELFDNSLSGASTRITASDQVLFGTAVSGGDLDGDGLSDLVSGSPLEEDGFDYRAGTAHVFLGDELSYGMSVLEDDAILEGESGSDRLGTAMDATGDLNGDGYADLVVGVPEDDNGDVNGGGVMVVFGEPSLSGTLEPDARLLGGQYRARAGASVAVVEDIDGNNRDELLVGAPGASVGSASSGVAYFVLGGGLSGTSILDDEGILIVGEGEGDAAGTSVADAGDFDGDGVSDLLVGAPGHSSVYTDGGAAYLLSGVLLR